MESNTNMKLKLTNAVAGKLSAAPHSTAKAELIEELSGNLYRRYLDFTASGLSQEEACRQALDCLGDTDELVEYLNSLQPDEPLPELVLRPDQGDSGQLEELLKNVEEIVKGALNRAKSALQDAKDITEDSLGICVEDMAKGAREKVGQAFQKARDAVEHTASSWSAGGPAPDTSGDAGQTGRPEEGEAPPASRGGGAQSAPEHGPEPEREEPSGDGWQFSMGYSREKGGFFTQWEGSGSGGGHSSAVPLDEPIHSGALEGLDVQVSGDVTIRLTEAEDGDVVIGGDVEWLEAFRSDDGVLTVRQNAKTASSSFFFGRGLYSADVTLALPRRYWKFLRITTASGDVEITGDVALGLVTVKTASGDLEGRLPQCEQLCFRSASGDLDWEGCAGLLQAETASGDLTFHGRLSRIGQLLCKSVSGDIDWEGTAQEAQFQTVSGDITLTGQLERLQASSMSGEVEVAGAVAQSAHCSSTSGGVRLESAQLPREMELSSRSGDCEARIPDTGSFTVLFKTTSGRFQSEFFSGTMGGRHNTFTYRKDADAVPSDQAVPTYRISSVSGSLYLYKY